MLWFFVGLESLWRSLVSGWKDPVFRTLAVAVVSILAIGTLFYKTVEGFRWIDALYFSVTTLATVGYGDLHPNTDVGKLFTIGYIFAGLGIIVAFAQRLARHLFTRVYEHEEMGGPVRPAAVTVPEPEGDGR